MNALPSTASPNPSELASSTSTPAAAQRHSPPGSSKSASPAAYLTPADEDPTVQRGRATPALQTQNLVTVTASSSTVPTPTSASEDVLERSRTLRRPSPGLLARMKLLDSANKARVVSSPVLGQDKIGRIPESQLAELDRFHRDRSINIERRGREWSSLGVSPALVPQHTGTSTATGVSETASSTLDTEIMDATTQQGVDSDQSSIISTSDHVAHSDSDHSVSPEVVTEDKQKYRLPELEKVQTPTNAGADPYGTAALLADDANYDPEAYSTATIITHQPERPPTPPPKDSPIPESPAPGHWKQVSDGGSDLDNYLRRPSRANSIYSLSRVSFTNQILQLTSIKLPPSESLASGIKAIPTSVAASRALGEAAQQIQQWIKKGAEVLDGLDAEDDVEWAAAAGREGLAEVDAAITRFEDLVNVYVTAIEDLNAREDISKLPPSDLKILAGQMDEVVGRWADIKSTLKGIKQQVEIAMEWEELWNTVLGEIGQETEALSRLVFEMEEKRHRIASKSDNSDNLELGELQTIVEEAPKIKSGAIVSPRFNYNPAFGSNPPLLSPTSETHRENSNLMALSARMQPLRASLDFLPMRLQTFRIRAERSFPSACEELDQRKVTLEAQWKKLDGDATSLHQELSEDQWVQVFRDAGSKALNMWNSTYRSVVKLRKAFEENRDPDYINMKLQTYREKKPHYVPSIEQVLNIIKKGVENRLTVNGEIIRMQTDIRNKLTELNVVIKEMDEFLEDANLNNGQQLRDSISTILSTEHSFAGAYDTPGSSPASSTIMSRKSSDHERRTGSPASMRKSRQTSFNSSSSRNGSNDTKTTRRVSGLATPGSSHIPHKTPLSRSSAVESRISASPSPSSGYRMSTPTQRRLSGQQNKSDDNKPRWNVSVNMNGTVIGHNFKPLSATTPSPHRKATPTIRTPHSLRSVSSSSSIPMPSPLSRGSMPSPLHSGQRPPSAASKRMSTLNLTPNTPARRPGSSLRGSLDTTRLHSSGAASSGRKSVLLTPEERSAENSDNDEVSPTIRASKPVRPISQIANRRQSSLPQPKSQRVVSGRTSRALEERPKWR